LSIAKAKTPHCFQRGVKGQRAKGQRDPRFRAPSSTCTQRSGVVAAPAAVEPAAAPVPPAATPVEVADAQAAIAVAVHRPPEEDVFAFPLLGNEVRIGQQVVEDVGVQDGLTRHLLTELVALDVLAALLTL